MSTQVFSILATLATLPLVSNLPAFQPASRTQEPSDVLTNKLLLTEAHSFHRVREKRDTAREYSEKVGAVDTVYSYIRITNRPSDHKIHNITYNSNFNIPYVTKQCTNYGHNAAKSILRRKEHWCKQEYTYIPKIEALDIVDRSVSMASSTFALPTGCGCYVRGAREDQQEVEEEHFNQKICGVNIMKTTLSTADDLHPELYQIEEAVCAQTGPNAHQGLSMGTTEHW